MAANAGQKQGFRIPILEGVLPIDRAAVPKDIVAGVTLAALAIPEVMGYSSIAGMPVVTGLYTLLLPMALYALLGSSRHLVVGADSATAAVMAAGLAGLAAKGSSEYVALAGTLCLMTGALLLVARLVKLGFIADYLSRTVLIGFLTGVGVQVACGQVGGLFGIPEGKGWSIDGHQIGGSVAKAISTLGNLGEISWWTFGVAAGVIIVTKGMKLISKAIPGALVAVIGAIIASYALDLEAKGVSTLGKVGGLPSLAMPSLEGTSISALMGTAVSIAVLVIAQSAATSRAYAARFGDKFDENTDIVGLAAASVGAGFTGTYVVNGSPTKTQMVTGAGGRSQISSFTTCLIVLIVVAFLTGPLSYMPSAVLAAVVFLIGLELIDIKGMRRVWDARKDEFVVAAITAAVVIAIGAEQGIITALALSALDHLRRSYHPRTSVLVKGAHGLERRPATAGARSEPGVAVFRFAAPLYYANANLFQTDVTAIATAGAGDQLRWICIDAGAITDIDYTGGQVLAELERELGERGVHLAFAEMLPEVRDLFPDYGLDDLAKDDVHFPDVETALERLAGAPAAAPAG